MGVVDDGTARPREGEPPPGALDAPPDRPGARTATSLADGWGDPDEAREALLAERRAGDAAAGAAGREDDTEQAHAPTVRPSP
jgi:hypothetical protein